MGTQAIVPNLVLAQRVIDKMAAAASHFIEDETGEAMVGVVTPGNNTNGVPTIYVLDTISPDEGSVVRRSHTFQQGDERQDEIIWWLQENWHARRQQIKDTAPGTSQQQWDEPLRYLGDWHKQPGYMIAPSGGDLMTALDWLDDPDTEADYLLVPIVTLGHPSTIAGSDASVNYVTRPMNDGSTMRVDWWYIHRDVRMFQPINPVVYPNNNVPELTRYPWHLVMEDRAKTEMAQLQGDGLFVSLLLWDADGKTPLEICFMMARQGAKKILMVGTYADYPESPPFARVAPFRQMTSAEDDIYDIFSSLWAESEPVTDPPGWRWTADSYLIDYVRTVETHLKLVPDTADSPAAGIGGGESADVAADDSADSADAKTTTDEPSSTAQEEA